MNLTADEIKLIEDYRQNKADNEPLNKIEVLHLLQTTANYYEWLKRNKVKSSFSTFFNAYGYRGDFCQWLPYVFFERIQDLIQMADEWVSGV